jgi:hypothetical protein
MANSPAPSNYRWICAALIAVLIGWGSNMALPLHAKPVQAAARLTLEDVLEIVRSGESEELVVARIKRNARPFDLSIEERTELKREGMSDTIIKYLVDPTLPYAPPAAPPPPPPAVTNTREYPKDEMASNTPPEIGAYLMDNSQLNRIDLKTLVGATEGGLGSRITIGLIKKRVIGQLVGASARWRTSSFPATFYLRLGEPGKIEEVVLVSLERSGSRRELEFSDNGAQGKAIVKVDRLKEFEALEVGPGLYRITVQTLQKGEYFFYLIGSADPQKGIQGKGYDFGVN